MRGRNDRERHNVQKTGYVFQITRICRLGTKTLLGTSVILGIIVARVQISQQLFVFNPLTVIISADSPPAIALCFPAIMRVWYIIVLGYLWPNETP